MPLTSLAHLTNMLFISFPVSLHYCEAIHLPCFPPFYILLTLTNWFFQKPTKDEKKGFAWGFDVQGGAQ